MPIHHRRSIRLPDYDYGQPGTYFITICSCQKISIFGVIVSEEMQLASPGRIAQEEWNHLPARFPGLELGAFVVMPNHVHGILTITNATQAAGNLEKFGHPVVGSIPTIVRSYKASVAWRVNRLAAGPNHLIWQRNYYEHVIRNSEDRERIEAYIRTNIQRWDDDSLK